MPDLASGKRHWTINGRFLTQSLTGVQRYAREIVRALDGLVASRHPLVADLDLEILVPPDARDDLELTSIRVRRVGGRSGHRWEQLDLPRSLKGGLLSLGNVGPLAVRRQIVCMHDVNVRDVPESYSLAFKLSHRVLQPCLGAVAARVASVSRYSMSRLVHHRVCGASKLFHVPNGHEHALLWRPGHSSTTLKAAGRSTVVVVGTPAPHKNIRLLLDMADRFASEGLRLAVVGDRDPRVFAQAAGGAKRDAVDWLGRISDHELAALLKDALCLAFPSFSEGFGLPVLEAMALGCPVVVSDRASLPEICGSAALYASPNAPEAWLDAFRALRDDESLRKRNVELGRARSRLFSWQNSAQIYLRAMAAVDGANIEVEAERTPAWSPGGPANDDFAATA